MNKYLLALALAFSVFAVTGAVFAVEDTTTTDEAVTEEASSEATTPVGLTKAQEATGRPMPKGLSQALAAKYAKYRALLAGRAESGTGAAPQRSLGQAKRYAQADSSCIQKAVDAREVKVTEAWSMLSTTISGALADRQQALFDAWGGDEETRGASIKAAWDTWKKAHRAAFRTMRDDRNAAWKVFRETVRSECKTELPREEALNSDTSGTLAL